MTESVSVAAPPPKTRRPGPLRTLLDVVADLRQSRDLLTQLVLRDVRIRYKQAVMGFGWAVFMPLLIVFAGVVVRLAMAQFAGTKLVPTELASLAVKAVPWAFFVGALGFAVNSLTTNMNLVAKIYFPREVLPLSAVIAQAWDATIAGVVVGALLPFFGVRLHASLLWAPVLLLLLLLFTAAVSLTLSCANLFFRDVKYIVQVLLTFGIFFTPVFFDAPMLGKYAEAAMLNPLGPILEGLRLAVVDGDNLLRPIIATAKDGSPVVAWHPWYLAYAATVSIVGLLLSVILFRRSSRLFAEYV